MLQRSRHVLHVTWRRYDNESGTSWKLLEEDVTKYQERLASDLTEMLQHIRIRLASYLTKTLRCIRNVLQVTSRRCYNVSGTSCKALQEDVTTYQERLASVCTWTWTMLPHPTQPVTDHERIVQCLCVQDSKKDDEVAVPVSTQEHERYYPTPPHRQLIMREQCSACVCRTARKMMRLLCLTPCPSPSPQVLP